MSSSSTTGRLTSAPQSMFSPASPHFLPHPGTQVLPMLTSDGVLCSCHLQLTHALFFFNWFHFSLLFLFLDSYWSDFFFFILYLCNFLLLFLFVTLIFLFFFLFTVFFIFVCYAIFFFLTSYFSFSCFHSHIQLPLLFSLLTSISHSCPHFSFLILIFNFILHSCSQFTFLFSFLFSIFVSLLIFSSFFSFLFLFSFFYHISHIPHSFLSSHLPTVCHVCSLTFTFHFSLLHSCPIFILISVLPLFLMYLGFSLLPSSLSSHILPP